MQKLLLLDRNSPVMPIGRPVVGHQLAMIEYKTGAPDTLIAVRYQLPGVSGTGVEFVKTMINSSLRPGFALMRP